MHCRSKQSAYSGISDWVIVEKSNLLKLNELKQAKQAVIAVVKDDIIK